MVRTTANLQADGRRRPEGSRSAIHEPRARDGDAARRRGAAGARGRQAAAPPWWQPSFLDLRAVFSLAISPIRARRRGGVSSVPIPGLSIASRFASCGASRCKVKEEAGWAAQHIVACAAEAAALAPGLLGSDGCRAYYARGRARGAPSCYCGGGATPEAQG